MLALNIISVVLGGLMLLAMVLLTSDADKGTAGVLLICMMITIIIITTLSLDLAYS